MRKFLLLCFSFVFALGVAQAQERTISGKVTSSDDGSTLPGVNVVLKGTTNGTVTDVDGNYKMTIPEGGGTLVFSFIGLQTQEVVIGDRSVVDTGLSQDVTQLSEIVVTGYGTQAKRDLTGSIASVSGKDIASMPVQSFDQALQGRAAGVNISTPNGVLNNPPVIRIRGVSSISLSSFPLVVVDGVPTFTGDLSTTNSAANNPLSNINPADIESVEVLKDASASAIYGSRASAGVILITTKRGSKGKSKVSLDSWVGATTAFRLFDVLNAQEYMDIKNEAVRNLNANRLVATGSPGTNVEGFRPSYNADGSLVETNWYDKIYQTGMSSSNNLSFSGGTDNTSYYLSVGYTKQEGMLKTNTFTRASARLNMDQKVFDWMHVGANISYANNLNSGPQSGSTGQAFSTAGVGRLPLVLPPNAAAFNPDGSYSTLGAGLGPWANVAPDTGAPLAVGYYNPVLILDKNTFTSEADQVQGSVYANFQIVKGLNFRTMYGIDRLTIEDISFATPLGGDGFSTGGSATNTYATRNRWNWQNTLQYDFKAANKHSFSILLGAEEQHTQTDRWGATRTTVADNFFVTWQGNYTNIAVANNFQGENYLVSYFGRLNYDFNKKYFMSLNIRRDGYSAWANKWGNFYGASVGYTISEEDFWKNTSFLSALSFFKVKASYGEVGNSNGIADFASLQLYNSGLYANVPTLAYNQAGNPALSWEQSKKTDIGFAYGILNDRIQGEFSYYLNQVDGLILDVQQAASKGIPNPTGINTIPANVGSMRNAGIELSLKFNAINTGSFNWTINANVTTLQNEVLQLNTETARIFTAIGGLESPSVTVKGQPVGSILAVPSIGINPANGRRMFQKADGTVAQYDHLGTGWTDVATGLTTSSPSQLVDGQYYGPTLPTWYGGFDNTFRYKNFDFGIFLQFSGGNVVYNGTKAGLRDQRFWNSHAEILTERWTPENPGGTIPRIVYGDNVSNGSALVISENVESGTFLRGRNISLGYSFPKTMLDKIKVSNLRVYAQCQNAFLITSYTGIDPENQGNGNSPTGASVDRNSVGQARTFTLGLNLGF